MLSLAYDATEKTKNFLESHMCKFHKAICDGLHFDVYIQTCCTGCQIPEHETRGFISKTQSVACPFCPKAGGMQLLASSFALAAFFWSNFCCY